KSGYCMISDCLCCVVIVRTISAHCNSRFVTGCERWSREIACSFSDWIAYSFALTFFAAKIPADCTSTFGHLFLSHASAMGLRHVFPVQTNNTLIDEPPLWHTCSRIIQSTYALYIYHRNAKSDRKRKVVKR